MMRKRIFISLLLGWILGITALRAQPYEYTYAPYRCEISIRAWTTRDIWSKHCHDWNYMTLYSMVDGVNTDQGTRYLDKGPTTYNYNFLVTPQNNRVAFRTYAIRRYGNNCNDGGGEGYASIAELDLPYSSVYNISETGWFVAAKFSSTATIKVYPTGIKLFNDAGQSTGGTLPERTKITYKVNKNLTTASFTWYYKVGPYGSPVQFSALRCNSYRSAVTFCGNDIKSDFLKAIKNRQHIYIYAIEDWGRQKSAEIVLDPQLEAPRILKNRVSKTDPVCAEEETGKVKIFFDRKLYEGERLHLYIEGVHPTTLKTHYEEKTLSAQESFVEFTGLPAGNYEMKYLQAYDPGGNKINTGNSKYHECSFSLTDPLKPDFFILMTTDVHCYGGKDGKLFFFVGGGTGSLEVLCDRRSYILDPYRFAEFPALAAGEQEIRLRDARGCIPKDETGNEKVWTFTVGQPEKPVRIQPESISEPTGYGRSDGEIRVVAMDGSGGGYRYRWSKEGDSIEGDTVYRNGLSSGNYRIEVRDSNYRLVSPKISMNVIGCVDEIDIFLDQPRLLTVSVELEKAVSCKGYMDGELKAVADGGVGKYEYRWQVRYAGGWVDISERTLADSVAEDLKADTYRVLVWDKNDNYAESDSFRLGEPESLSLDFNLTPPLCSGGTDGKVEAIVSGGNGGYSYRWWGSDVTASSIGGGAGEYTVNVSDLKGCGIRKTVTLEQPEPLQASFDIVKPSSDTATDGSILVITKGGTPDYRYEWKDRESTSNLLTGVKTDSVPYCVTVSDAHGCDSTLPIRVVYPLQAEIRLKKLISCHGEADGLLEAFPSWGVSRHYRYRWYRIEEGRSVLLSGNGKISPALNAGTYRVEVQDSEGDTVSAFFQLPEPTPLSATYELFPPSRPEVADGKILIVPSGGTPGYTYRWEYEGETINPLTGIPARNTPYRVTVKDAHSCEVQLQPILLCPLRVKIKLKQPVSCKGRADALLEAVPEGGRDDTYRYEWQKQEEGRWNKMAAETKISSSLGPGHYRVVITDCNDSTAMAEYMLTEPDLLTATFDTVLPSSAYAADGRIIVSPSGGTPFAGGTYRYTWDYGQATVNPLSGIAADSVPYHVVVEDSRGCTVELFPRLIYPLGVYIRLKDSVSCYGKTDGCLEAVTEGGVSRFYTWRWYGKKGATFDLQPSKDAVAGNLPAGEYLVKVTDTENNEVLSESFVLSEPDSLVVALSKGEPSCKNDRNGWLEAHVDGGTLPYVYRWKGEGEGNSERYEALPQGAYEVQVTDRRGCEAFARDTLYEPDRLSVKHKVYFPSVYGGRDGMIRLAVSGGTVPYEYFWEYDGSGESVLKGLAASETPYRVTVTDAHGCMTVDTPRMYNPLIVSVEIRDSVSCYGREDGRLAAVVAGGVGGPYVFKWDVVADGQFRPLENRDSLLPTAGEGIYRVKAWDRDGNSAVSAEFVFSQPDSLQLRFLYHDPLCYLDKNGWISGQVEGGTQPYRYFWSGPEESRNPGNQERWEGLGEGRYELKITDRRGCEVKREQTLTHPDALNVSHEVRFPSVYGGQDGSIMLTVKGGTEPYLYTWEESGQAGNPLTGLAAREIPYRVTVTDRNGCRTIDSMRVYDPVTVELEESGVIICSGDANAELTAHVKGGVGGPYRYVWYAVDGEWTEQLPGTDSLLTGVGVGSYRSAAFDREGNVGWSADYAVVSPDSLRLDFRIGHLRCKGDTDGWIEAIPKGGEGPYRLEWAGGGSSSSLGNLGEGFYEVKMTDKRGCFVTRRPQISAPDELEPEIKFREPLAWQGKDGAVWVTVRGGTSPYTYVWKGFPCVSDTLLGIPAGGYEVTVTDAHRCRKTVSTEVTQPPLLEAGIRCKQMIPCYGGREGVLEARASGGVGPDYRYDWYRMVQERPEYFFSGKLPEHLSAGEYRLKVTDENGISAWSAIYRLEQPDSLVVTVRTDSVLCKGGMDGRVTAFVTGGTSPYEYLWSSGEDAAEAGDLPEGRYLVLVTDARRCRAEAAGQVASPEELRLEASLKPIWCVESTGEIHLHCEGGVAPYKVLWEDGSVDIGRERLGVGVYPVEVKDAHGCVRRERFELLPPEPLRIELGEDVTLCREQRTDIEPRCSQDIVEYKWLRNGVYFSSLPTVTVDAEGTYRLEILTERGCRGSDEIQVRKNDAEIDCNFAMASEAEEGDVLEIVNTSLPMPEYCEWLLPSSSSVSVQGEDRDLLELVIAQTGVYTVGLRSAVGDCEAVLYKKVTVMPRGEQDPETRVTESVIQDIQVWPNPNDGNFRVRVGLRKEADGIVRLYTSSGVLVRELRCEGSDRYEFHLNESLPVGIYILHIVFGTEREAVRVAIE